MDYNAYYMNQAGGEMDNFYRGQLTQKGYGLGGMFRKFFRWVVPLVQRHAVPVLKEGAKVVGSEVLKSASNLASDVVEGKNIKESFQNRFEDTIENLKTRVENHLDSKGGKIPYKRTGSKKNFIILKKRKKSKSKELDIFNAANTR